MSLFRIHREVHCLLSRALIHSLIANSSASGAVVWPAEALENNICCSSLYKYIVEIACMFLSSIVLVSVAIIRVEKPQDTDGQETLEEIYNLWNLSNCKSGKRYD